MSKFRLYIDETGNSDLESSTNPNHRFLTLTGIAIDLDYVLRILNPEMETLKIKYFNAHPDEPIVFHRKDMVNAKGYFQNLQDEEFRNKFNSDLVECFARWEYVVFSVILDKLEHKNSYQVWRYDPYHYCLKILIERYALFLEENDYCGDVLAESRGGKEDVRLKDAFARLHKSGSEYISSERLQKLLTSGQLKVKSKASNISGLQLADLIAHPSRLEMIKTFNLQEIDYSDKFAVLITTIIKKKYYQKDGKIIGYGKKKLP